MARGHFGAFFKRAYRENDYLWGRLDGAERLIWMLFDAAGEVGDGGTVDRLTADAFREILKEERASLTEVQDVIEDIERVLDGRLASLPGCTQPPTRT